MRANAVLVWSLATLGAAFLGSACVEPGAPGGADLPGSDLTQSGPATGERALCTEASDCEGVHEMCAERGATYACDTGDCRCQPTCDPFMPHSQTGCLDNEVCSWLWDGTGGMCVAHGGRTAEQGDACTADYDPAGTYQGDSCDLIANQICWGATPEDPNGTCRTFCRTGTPGLCELAGASCRDVGVDLTTLSPELVDLGLCAESDHSFACTDAAQCQDQSCAGGMCTAACETHRECRVGSLCVDARCRSQCPGGDAGDRFCASLNPDSVCEWVAGETSEAETSAAPSFVCAPKCTDHAECPSGTCLQSGHC